MSNRLQYRSQLSRCVEVLIPGERILRLSVYYYLVLILWPVYLFLLPAVFVYGRWWVLLFMIFPGALLLHHTITTVHQGIAQTLSVLENGTIIEQGMHNELLANKNGLYKTLTELQFAV